MTKQTIGFSGVVVSVHPNGATIGVSVAGNDIQGVVDTLGNHGLVMGADFGSPETFAYTVTTPERLLKVLASIVWHRLASRTFSGAGEFDSVSRTLAAQWVTTLPHDSFLPRESVVNPSFHGVGVADGMAI